MENQKTDWRKFRKSTHLASPDLEIMESEGKELIFTIKEIKHEQKVNVSGTKMDGFFCYFKEDVKPLKINNTNLQQLAVFAKNKGIKLADAYCVEEYAGLIIELYVDHNVKFMGAITDGIRIKPIQPVINKTKPEFTEANFKKAAAASASIEQIKKAYTITSETEQKYIDYATK